MVPQNTRTLTSTLFVLSMYLKGPYQNYCDTVRSIVQYRVQQCDSDVRREFQQQIGLNFARMINSKLIGFNRFDTMSCAFLTIIRICVHVLLERRWQLAGEQ